MTVFGLPAEREAFRRHLGRAEQLAGAELLVRGDGAERGVRTVRLRSGEIDVEVVVDRALDLGQASVRGVPVAWLSPTGLVGPWLADPHGWGPFRSFFGGLLTTCGLEHVLGPQSDDASAYRYPALPEHEHPLHGRVANTPGRLLAYGLDWERGCVYARGDVRQTAVFGETLVLEREVRIALGGRVIEVDDVVRNEGFAPTPQPLLYHVNAGYPLVAPHAEVRARVGAPRTATPAAEGVDWRTLEPPRWPATEQVWEHTPQPAGDGMGDAALLNDDIGDGRPLGLRVRWSLDTLPLLLQWRVTSHQNYVVGLEPSSLGLEGRTAAREAGRLPSLEPGETRRYALRLELLCDAAELAAARAAIGGEAP